jgi:predicted nucleotidyltransferase
MTNAAALLENGFTFCAGMTKALEYAISCHRKRSSIGHHSSGIFQGDRVILITAATVQKRQELTIFIERELEPNPAVQAVIGVGSVASGLARPDSDIDAIIFLDPFDPYIVPAEFKWRPSDGSFHSIFSQELGLEACLQFDFARLDLDQWADPSCQWPEGRCAELHDGWLAFDRTGRVAQLIVMCTTYSDEIRTAKLDEAITWLDQHLSADRPQRRWDSLGPVIAHDRLQAAYGYLVQALFAYNRRWRPWRNREMSSLLALSWLPEGFGDRVLDALNAPAPDHAGYLARVEALRALFQELTGRLVADGEYGDDIVSEAFIRSHGEPGRAWNMDEWNAKHLEQSGEHQERIE